MFLPIEGDEWINLTLISRIEFDERRKAARLYNAGVLEKESGIAYQFLKDPANRKFLLVQGKKG